MITYQISPNTCSHTFSISLNFTATQKTQLIKIPTWIPGSYMIREFGKNIITINATGTSNHTQLNCTQIDKNTWQIDDIIEGSSITIHYTVYAFEIGIRTAYLDNNRGYF